MIKLRGIQNIVPKHKNKKFRFTNNLYFLVFLQLLSVSVESDTCYTTLNEFKKNVYV